MEQEVLDLMKKEYKRKKEIANDYKKLKEKIEALEKNEYVKEYLYLTRKIKQICSDEKKLEDDNMMYEAYLKYLTLIEKTNGIYVYIGTYSKEGSVDRNSPYARYRVYFDLERNHGEQIGIRECKEFEKNHKIIYPDYPFPKLYYSDIRKEFAVDLITLDQEEAVAKVLKKHKK